MTDPVQVPPVQETSVHVPPVQISSAQVSPVQRSSTPSLHQRPGSGQLNPGNILAILLAIGLLASFLAVLAVPNPSPHRPLPGALPTALSGASTTTPIPVSTLPTTKRS